MSIETSVHPNTITNVLTQAYQRLHPVHDSAYLDSELLLAHILGTTRTHLHTWPDKELSTEQFCQFMELVYSRSTGTPVAYLLRHQEFWSMDFTVTQDTLIPRPETELLVELALELVPADQKATIADLGTGCGAVALAIAKERPACRVIATDVSVHALKIALHNADRHKLTDVEFRLGDWLAPLADELADVIVSNPPYVPENDEHLKRGDVRFEPGLALGSGSDGLNAIRIIADKTRMCLNPGGWLCLEHGYDQKEKVRKLLIRNSYVDIHSFSDLSGNDRVTIAQWSK